MKERLDQWLAHWADRTPDRCFVRAEEGETSWRAAEERVRASASRLGAGDLGPVIVVRARNTVAAVTDLLAAGRAGRSVLWLPDGLAAAEVGALSALAGARVELLDGAVIPLGKAEPAAGRWPLEEAALAFATSGSTGAPRLALRSAASLTDEGLRYLSFLQLTADDCLGMALPIGHAFAFGAGLAAALVSGASMALVRTATARLLAGGLLRHGVTVLPLVRALAAPLSRMDGERRIQARLRVAMVGASPISEELSAAFESKWGLPLSRNYGSSETGALLATRGFDAAAGTGRPLPGVECRLVGPGHLWVKLQHSPLGHLTPDGLDLSRLSPGGEWSTGDLFQATPAEGLQFVARTGGLIRRGGHSIAPAEVEAAIASHPAVDEALVVGSVDPDGEEELIAYVKPREGLAADPVALRVHLKERLAAYKHPGKWQVVSELPRTWSGKSRAPAPAPSPWKLGLRRAGMAFRATEAVLAAEGVGLLAALAQPALPDEVARTLRLDPGALAVLLEVLVDLGVARREGERVVMAEPSEGWRPGFLALESELRDSWLHRAAIIEVLRGGVAARPFDLLGSPSGFSERYLGALGGAAQRALVRTALRHLRLPAGARLWEIGRAIGLFTEELSERAPVVSRLSPLAPAPALVTAGARDLAEVEPPREWGALSAEGERFDVITVVNAVHWLPAAEAPAALARLVEALRPGGLLAIVDTFLERAPAAEGADRRLWLLDWLTHGGLELRHLDDLLAAVAAASGETPTIRRLPGFDYLAVTVLGRETRTGSNEHDRNERKTEERPGEGAAA
jgi:acyl-CoA synthetase (AMP-forming)/AMP-acid ligase II/SAM-dependent methyltransferase